MIEISGIPVSLDAFLPGKESLQKKEVAHALGVAKSALSQCVLVRKSVDARKKSWVHFTTTFACVLDDSLEQQLLTHPPKGLHVKEFKPYQPLDCPACEATGTILVVGMGPAGLFAALYLARCGLKPLVIERGFDVDRRGSDIDHFEQTGQLNPHSNVQFGEGGAGTFSDGKLTTNIKSPFASHVLRWFVEAGAPESILTDAHPHMGSDKLPGIVAHMRDEIIRLGGEVLFGTRLADWKFEQGAIQAVTLERVETGEKFTRQVNRVILACGHSARDTFELCRDTGFAMEQKPFSVGVRIEHPQQLINDAQWGKAAAHPALGAAEYKLAVHLPQGRSVYTFCMCPGGEVVAAASEEGGVVTNGMSRYARDEENANAALLVTVEPSDLQSTDVLAGVHLQRTIEQAAFALAQEKGAQPYQAPCQTVGNFLKEYGDCGARDAQTKKHKRNQASILSVPVKASYGRGVFEVSLADCLPSFVVEALAQALPLMGRKLAHFDDPAALMTAPETRSSSPVRICRNKNLQAYWSFEHTGATSARAEEAAHSQNEAGCESGVYPCGEGPGYAGGIMSAACDGLRVAQKLIATLAN